MTKTPKPAATPRKTANPPAAKPTRAARKAAPVAPQASLAPAPPNRVADQEAPVPLAPATKVTQADPPPAAPPKAGVIATLIALLRTGGGTKPELYQGLLAKFPERGGGMKITISVQLAALPRKGKLVIHKGTNEAGGVRYWADPLPTGEAP